MCQRFTVKAAAVIDNMDQSVNPCDDFYQFACGNFLKQTVVEEDIASQTPLNAIEGSIQKKLLKILTEPIQPNEQKPLKMAKLFYKSCRNTGNNNCNEYTNDVYWTVY